MFAPVESHSTGPRCSGFRPLAKPLQAYPRCRVPAAPLAGALLISISAVSVSCCAHLSAPDVWQIAVLGSTASLPYHAGNARLLSTSLSSGTAGAGFLMGSWMCADPLTRCRFVCGMGVL